MGSIPAGDIYLGKSADNAKSQPKVRTLEFVELNHPRPQSVDLLKKDGKTVDVHYYLNEGHGFLKRENQIDSMRRTIDWFDKYLKGHP